jgi:hypothetical protein
MPYVYSTLTAGQDYLNYVQGPADIKIPEGNPVRIDGGHGVATKKLITPIGVATEVTDEELSYLRRNEGFKAHVKQGFIIVSESKSDPEKVVPDMIGRDRSSPVVPSDYTATPEEKARPQADFL